MTSRHQRGARRRCRPGISKNVLKRSNIALGRASCWLAFVIGRGCRCGRLDGPGLFLLVLGWAFDHQFFHLVVKEAHAKPDGSIQEQRRESKAWDDMNLLHHVVTAWTMKLLHHWACLHSSLKPRWHPLSWTATSRIGQAFQAWSTFPTGDAPIVDLVEMKVRSDDDFLYVYVRLGADLDLTDVLYPHNLFLQIDVDMDASTGYLVREGFGSELGIDFNGLFAYTNFGPADQVNFSEIGLIPAPTVTSTEFELFTTRCGPRRRQPALSTRLHPPVVPRCPVRRRLAQRRARIRARLQRREHICGGAVGLGQSRPNEPSCLRLQRAGQRPHPPQPASPL